MDDTTDPLADEALPRARLALLLEQFSRLDDERESWRVMYPLSEVLLLLTCATIASCDDFGFLATFGDQVPAVWPQSPCRLTSWFRFTAASPKVAKSPMMMRHRRPGSLDLRAQENCLVVMPNKVAETKAAAGAGTEEGRRPTVVAAPAAATPGVSPKRRKVPE